ncbi:MAG TPA: hypothetical protein DIC35_03835 [Candidatus Moranbacteria bacterium]|nr:hypothetical protein [Candidatus Moranbacteria bacterium]
MGIVIVLGCIVAVVFVHICISFWVYLKVTKGYDDEGVGRSELKLVEVMRNMTIEEFFVITILNPFICTFCFVVLMLFESREPQIKLTEQKRRGY